jgi:hypothetical protein
MKVKYDEDRYLPALGLLVKAGEEIEVPDDPFGTPEPVTAVASPKKATKTESVVSTDGDSPQ